MGPEGLPPKLFSRGPVSGPDLKGSGPAESALAHGERQATTTGPPLARLGPEGHTAPPSHSLQVTACPTGRSEK